MTVKKSNLTKADMDFIKSAVEAAATGGKVGNAVQNCTFVGVQYDAKAVDAITKIAEGLIENAKGFTALAQVLKASNVEVETMLKIVSQ